MKAIRKYSVFGASLALAFGIGYVMQSTAVPDHPAFVLRALEADDPDVRLAAAQTARETDMMRSITTRPVTPVAAQIDAAGAARTPLPVVELPADFLKEDAAAATLPEDTATLARTDPTVTDACTRSITLLAQPAALLQLTLDAPCDADARVVIRHAGLAITERFSPAGILDVTLPAFSDLAEVSVAFIDGETLNARAMVPDIALYDRVAVQWQSPDSFQLHAFEFGATFDSPGHVSAAAPRDAGYALRATGGFLLLLGNSSVTWPLLAEVYTFPTARVPRSGTITIEIEAMVTPEVCGREILGETIEIHAGAPVTVRDLTVSMPGCDAEGQFIVLKNALEDLTIAAN